MTAVSIVMPSLFDEELFEMSIPPLIGEMERRDSGDELIVVDDTGEAVIETWMAAHYPSVQVYARAENGGYGQALFDGVNAARHELVFCMNPDVLVHACFLEPLVACLKDASVHSAVPRILLHGDPRRIESVTRIRMRDGLAEVAQPGLEDDAEDYRHETIPVAYAIGGACLLRRDSFLQAGGCDPIYEPFYWEDVDIGWNAWRSGQRVLYVPSSVVEHHHRGTIKTRVRERLVRAAIEKNRLLFQWKHLDTPKAIQEHMAALYRWAIDAWLRDEREELIWLALALEQLDEARASREALVASSLNFDELRKRSSS